MLIHAEHAQGFLCHFAGDAAGGAHFGEIAGTAQQTVGNARRAAAAAGNFLGAGFVHLDVKDFCRAAQNDQQIFRLVKIETMHDAETRSQRRCDQPGARGGADKRELAQMKWVNARAGALADHQVHAKILHRGI